MPLYKMVLHSLIIMILSILAQTSQSEGENQFCTKQDVNCKDSISSMDYNEYSYIFYDVNRPEGFNLRRDVYLRMATFVKILNRNKSHKYKLVLPPWSELFHWKSRHLDQNLIPWGEFFDISSLNEYIPVMEMNEYMSFYKTWKGTKKTAMIQQVYMLKHYEEMFETGDFKDKYEYDDSCTEKNEPVYFWGYDNVTHDTVRCLKFQGPASLLKHTIAKTSASSIMLVHAEILLHDTWGSPEYWKARRSMRFSKKLVKLADDFRKEFLNSTDTSVKVQRPINWLDEKPTRKAVGGNYLAVHLRRSDFLWGRAGHIPSIPYAAKQIRKIAQKCNISTVFLATDASAKEIDELKSQLEPDILIVRFIPSDEIKNEIKDGGQAIVDQIICSYAKHFVGTYESTFSFRIQEEREILGFPKTTTFNRLCGDKEATDKKCSQTTQWTIMY